MPALCKFFLSFVLFLVRHVSSTVLLAYLINAVIITLRAMLSGAEYCNRSCLCVCLWVCLFVYGSVTTITQLRASILSKLGL